MALVPSFHAYAPKADLAQAYLGGQRIAQEAAADAARISLGYAGLQQRAVEAQMEAQAREKAIQAQSMRAMQENEFTKAYHDAQLGIAQRRLQNDAEISAMRLNQAKQAFDQQQLFQRLRKQKTDAGMTDVQAAQEAFMESGSPGTPGFSSAIFQRPQQTETAGDRALRYKHLQTQKEDAMIKFGPKSPEYQKKAEELDKEIEAMFQKSTQGTAPATGSTQRWMVDPNTIPSFPPPASWFIGTPAIPQAQNVSISPQAFAGMGIGGPTPAQSPLPTQNVTGSFIGTPGGVNLFDPNATPANRGLKVIRIREKGR